MKENGSLGQAGNEVKLVSGATVSVEEAFLAFSNQEKGKFPFKNDFIKRIGDEIEKMTNNGDMEKIIRAHVK